MDWLDIFFVQTGAEINILIAEQFRSIHVGCEAIDFQPIAMQEIKVKNLTHEGRYHTSMIEVRFMGNGIRRRAWKRLIGAKQTESKENFLILVWTLDYE